MIHPSGTIISQGKVMPNASSIVRLQDLNLGKVVFISSHKYPKKFFITKYYTHNKKNIK